MPINIRETIFENRNDFVRVEVSNLIDEPIHHHRETEIVFVLKGSVRCKIHKMQYFLEEGDVVLVDWDDLHYFYEGSEDLICVRMYIKLDHFLDKYPNIDYMVFVCEKNDFSQSDEIEQNFRVKLNVVKRYMAQITLAELNDASKNEVENIANEFIDVLVKEFRGFFIEKNNFNITHKNLAVNERERIERITKYIIQNLEKKITLDDIANLEHLNIYYLSHLIKDNFGLGFQDLLNYLRTEYVEELLLNEDLNITQISNIAGFSTVSYMNKVFVKYYEMTPSEYRKQVRNVPRTYGKSYLLEDVISRLKGYSNLDEKEKYKSNLEDSALMVSFDKKEVSEHQFKSELYIASLAELILYYNLNCKFDSINLQNIYVDLRNEKNINMASLTEMLLLLLSKSPNLSMINEPGKNEKKIDDISDQLNLCKYDSSVINKMKNKIKNYSTWYEYAIDETINGNSIFSSMTGEYGLICNYISTSKLVLIETLSAIKGRCRIKEDTFIAESDKEISIILINNEQTAPKLKHFELKEDHAVIVVIRQTLMLGESDKTNLFSQNELSPHLHSRLLEKTNDCYTGLTNIEKTTLQGDYKLLVTTKAESFQIVTIHKI